MKRRLLSLGTQFALYFSDMGNPRDFDDEVNRLGSMSDRVRRLRNKLQDLKDAVVEAQSDRVPGEQDRSLRPRRSDPQQGPERYNDARNKYTPE